MHLDIPTLTIITGVIFATQTIAVFIQYKVNKTYSGLGWWLSGAVLQAVGFLLIPIVTIPSIWMLSVFANPLIIAGQLCLNVGIARFLGVKQRGWIPVSTFAVYIAFYLVCIFIRNSILWRSIVVFMTMAFISLQIGVTLWSRKKRHFAGSAEFTASVFLAYGCFQVFMTVLALYLPPLVSYYEIGRTPIRLLSFVMPIVGSMLWTFGFIIMVNQRLNAEMLEEKEKLQLVFNISPDAKIISRMSDGLIIDVNAGFLAMTGYSRDETIGRTVSDLDPWAKAEDRQSYLSRLQREGAVDDREYSFRRKDGSPFVGLISGRVIPIRESADALTVIYDITERKLNEDKINRLLAEKELILKEVHHRIKNNMNTIYSILSLQAGALRDPVSITALEDAGSRVQSMMVLYDKLYRSSAFSELSIAEYLPSLIDEIVSGFSNAPSVRVETRIDDIVLEAGMLQPLGIIVNELLTNIMKYAFAGRSDGRILVTASIGDDDRLFITIADDGNGMPESIDFENSPGFGLLLVKTLAKQMKATIGIERGNGTKIIIAIPIARASGRSAPLG
jgi:PAS domain S-box-containing protein